MRLTKRTNQFLLLLLVAIGGCTYRLDQEYINPVKKPDPLNVVVEINDPNFKDPYILDWATSFRLRFDITLPVMESIVSVKGNLVPATYSNQILQFVLDPLQIGTGIHTVTIQIKFRTLTGSLVDQLGGEYYLVEREFKIVIDNQIPVPVTPLSAKIENGYMVLRWDMGTDRSYRYQLWISKEIDGTLRSLGVQEFTASSKTMYIDSGYVGGLTQYNLEVYNSFTTRNLGTVQAKTPPFRITASKDENHVGVITLSDAVIQANFMLIGPRASRSMAISPGKIYLDTLYMGDQLRYRVIVYRNTFQNRSYDTTITISNAPPNMSPFSQVKVLPNQSKLMLLTGFGLERYNLSDLTKEEEWSTFYEWDPPQLGASANGNQVVASNTSINPLNLNERRGVLPYFGLPGNDPNFVTVSAFSDPSDSGLQGINFSSNGIPYAAIRDVTKTFGFEFVVWYDDFNEDVPVISEDGQFMCLNSKDQTFGNVYTRINGTWSVVGKVPPHSKYFRGHSTSELLVIGPTLQVFDLTSSLDGNGYFQPVRAFNYMSHDVVSAGYDLPSQYFYVQTLSENYSTIKTYNVSSFTQTGKVKAYIPLTEPIPTRHIYSHNFHFLTNGHGEMIRP